MERKLTAKDIVIYKEKYQLKTYINKTWGSIETFAIEMDLEISTLKNYLRGKIKIPHTFKGKLYRLFGIVYDDIVLTPTKQLDQFISTLEGNSSYDTDINSLIVYEEIKLACLDYKYLSGVSKINYLTGSNYLNRGELGVAFQYYERAIELASSANESNKELLIKTLYEVANKAYKQQNIELANKYFRRAKILLYSCQSIDHMIQYKFYYYYGLHLLHLKDYEYAIEMFEECMKLPLGPREKATAVNCIGLTYKKQGNLKKAIELYRNSIDEIGNENNSTKSSFYNNLAEALRIEGAFDEAVRCIEQAFELFGDHDDMDKKFNLYHTYSIINRDIGEYDKNIDKLIEGIGTSVFSADRNYIIQAIELLISLSSHKNEVVYLRRVQQLIIDLIQQSNKEASHEYISKLKSCLGDIALKIQQEKEDKHEENFSINSHTIDSNVINIDSFRR